MVSGQHSVKSIKIQLLLDGKNVFFARIKRPLWNLLQISIKDSEYPNRTQWIKRQIEMEFGIIICAADDLVNFNQLLEAHYYEDSNDWLRTRIRTFIKASNSNFIEQNDITIS